MADDIFRQFGDEFGEDDPFLDLSPAATIAVNGFFGEPAAPPAGGTIKVFLGGTWIDKPVKVWNGAAWVQRPLKRWNGSAWV